MSRAWAVLLSAFLAIGLWAGAKPNVATPFGGGSSTAAAASDLLATLVNAEVAVTTTANLTAATMHKCTATSVDYTVTLPAAASSSGKLVGVRIDGSSTKLVTVKGNASELIDGQNTRIMWSYEVAILLCNGTGWTKVGGKTIPMSASLGASGNQTFSSGAITALTWSTNLFCNAPAAMQTTASYRINILRPGQYQILVSGMTNATNSSAGNSGLYVYKNGSSIASNYFYAPASSNISTIYTALKTLAAGDYLDVRGYYTAGSYTTTYLVADTVGSANYLTLLEVPSW